MNNLHSALNVLIFNFWQYVVTIICVCWVFRHCFCVFSLNSRLVLHCLPATSAVVTLWAWQAPQRPVASLWGGSSGMCVYCVICPHSSFQSALWFPRVWSEPINTGSSLQRLKCICFGFYFAVQALFIVLLLGWLFVPVYLTAGVSPSNCVTTVAPPCC